MAVKIQFPNVRQSIESDLAYVRWVLTAGKILPKGLFLDQTLQVRASLCGVSSSPSHVIYSFFL